MRGLERSGVSRQCARPWRRSALWRMASSVHQKRTICGMQMRMLTTGHDPTPVGARAARNTTANAANGEGGRITEGGCSAVSPPRLPVLPGFV